MKVAFEILRQTQGEAPRIQRYELEAEPGNTVLDCLNKIKWEQDGTLGFRKNCRNTICGSCSMRINGRSTLACKESLRGELARLEPMEPVREHVSESSTEIIPTLRIAPMGNMPVIKDLIVDMDSFWQNLKAVDPYVSTAARQIPEREFLQTPAERDKLNQTGNCILCGACYSECNAREVNPNFVGPHALAKGWRTLVDTRDDRRGDRLHQYGQTDSGVWGCTRCYYCNAVCPMEVAPMDQIGRIKEQLLAQASTADINHSRALRHRKVLVDLVKRGGWIDERKFGLRVLGNSFRDLAGLFSLLPLGLTMLKRRKFPLNFEPSEGTQEVRSLIEAVQRGTIQNDTATMLNNPSLPPQSPDHE